MTISPRFLNAKPTISRRRNLEDLRELADGDELVDANGLLLALDLGGAHAPPSPRGCRVAIACGRRARRAPRMRRHRLGDVGVHRFLIDRAALALLARVAIGPRRHPRRRRVCGAPPPDRDGARAYASRRRSRPATPTRRDAAGTAIRAGDGTRARRARRDRPRTRAIRCRPTGCAESPARTRGRAAAGVSAPLRLDCRRRAPLRRVSCVARAAASACAARRGFGAAARRALGLARARPPRRSRLGALGRRCARRPAARRRPRRPVRPRLRRRRPATSAALRRRRTGAVTPLRRGAGDGSAATAAVALRGDDARARAAPPASRHERASPAPSARGCARPGRR